MKILYLHQYFVSTDEPGATRSYELARRLVSNGHEVDLLTTDRNPDASSGWSVRTISGIRVHSAGIPYDNAMGFAQRLKSFASFAIKASEYGASLSCDIVYATSTPLTIAWPAVRISKRAGVPLVFEVRDLWPEVPISMGELHQLLARPALRLEQFAYENASTVVSLSPGMTDHIAARFPAVPIVTIPNACDLDLFARKATAGDRFRETHSWLGSRPLISYLGTFGRANGVDYAIRVADELSRIAPDVRMLLMGSGRYLTEVRQLAQNAGLLDKTVFVKPPVAKKDVPEILHASDVALSLFIDVPILSTNSANKFFDALAAGTAVAINYGGWQAELIEQTGCGVVLPPKDPVLAAAQLAGFLSDRRQAAVAGIQARAVAEARFSRDDMARLLEEVLIDARRKYNARATSQTAEASSE